MVRNADACPTIDQIPEGATVTTPTAGAERLSERRFFTGLALAILAVVFVGFSRGFYLRAFFPDHPAPPEPFFAVHGIVYTAWIVLLLTQARLVARGRLEMHRRLGIFGAVLAVAMVVLGTIGALIAARRPGGFVEVPVPPLQFLAVPIFEMVLFPAFVAIGLANRRDPQAHKRWMVLATVGILTAAVARIPIIDRLGPPAYFAGVDLFILALAVWDFRTLGRLHPATLWGGLVLIASQPLRLVVSGTEGWLTFARWVTGLLGPQAL
jgi:uncharacterized membrane protein YozB (DUF420 family)